MSDAINEVLVPPDLLSMPVDATDRERLIALQLAMAAHIREQRIYNQDSKELRAQQNCQIKTLSKDMEDVKKSIFGAKVTWRTLVGLGLLVSGLAAVAAYGMTVFVGISHLGK